jgi:hypothetical protein
MMSRCRLLIPLLLIIGVMTAGSMIATAGAPSTLVTSAGGPVAGRVAHGQAPAVTPPAPRQAADDLVRLADEVAREVEALRGWHFKAPVRKELSTPRDVRRYIERRAQADLPPGRAERIQGFLRTIGLIPADCDLKATYLSLLESQVGGFYDADSRTMHLVERPGGMPISVERIMLAHELTHALDDQQVDLGAFAKANSGRSEDMDIVAASVVEGSATGLMLQYIARAQLSGRFDMQDLQQYARQEAERSKMLLAAPRYFSVLLASYICGLQFLARGDLPALLLAPDNRAFGQSFLEAEKTPPRSTEQVLHPAKYWDPAARDEPVVIDDAAAKRWVARDGRWVVHEDTVGEMLIAILTTPKEQQLDLMGMQLANAWTSPAATGWGGDRFFLLASGASAGEAGRSLKDLKGVWITCWDTPQDRDEFLKALDQGPVAGHATAPIGAMGAVVFFGVDEVERGALMKRLGQSPLPMTRDGRKWSPGHP